MLRLKAALQTETGPRPTNQDCLFAEIKKVADKTYGLFCVADGVGGLADGQYAASITVSFIERWWNEHILSLTPESIWDESNSCLMLSELLRSINEVIFRHSQVSSVRIGTTCSLLLLHNDFYHLVHVGDSRIYMAEKRMFRKFEFNQLTEDHSWSAEQLKIGLLPVEEIEAYHGKNKLTSCLGAFESPKIYSRSGYVKRRGVFIICSDGLYRVVSDDVIAKMLIRYKNNEKLVEKLMSAVKNRGYIDNTSVIAVQFSYKGKNKKAEYSAQIDYEIAPSIHTEEL